MWVLVCFVILVAVVVVAAVVFVVVVTIVVVILVFWSLLLLVVVAIVVAVGGAKKPVKLCKTRKKENWRDYQRPKSETNNINNRRLRGICHIFSAFNVSKPWR